MNALPTKPATPKEIIDDLVADVGILKVVFVTIARAFKRTRPPNYKPLPGVETLNDHLRADIGLPPREDHRAQVDRITMTRPHF